MVIALWILYFLIWAVGIYVNYKTDVAQIYASGRVDDKTATKLFALVVLSFVVVIGLAFVDLRTLLITGIASIFCGTSAGIMFYKMSPILNKI